MPELWGRPDKFETTGGPLNFQERTAYFGAIPHWMYFTALRKHGPQWSAFVIWLRSSLGTAGVVGL